MELFFRCFCFDLAWFATHDIIVVAAIVAVVVCVVLGDKWKKNKKQSAVVKHQISILFKYKFYRFKLFVRKMPENDCNGDFRQISIFQFCILHIHRCINSVFTWNYSDICTLWRLDIPLCLFYTNLLNS